MTGPSPSAARELLGHWVTAWHDGHRQALPFFPETSWAAVAGGNLKSPWASMGWSEGYNDYHRLVYTDGPRAAGFDALADRLLGPLQEARS